MLLVWLIVILVGFRDSEDVDQRGQCPIWNDQSIWSSTGRSA